MSPGRSHRKAVMSDPDAQVTQVLTNVGLAAVDTSGIPGENLGPLVVVADYANANNAVADHYDRFLVGTVDDGPGTQRYLENTNVLETRFQGENGTFRVLDFAPRFLLHDRVFRPTQLFRVVEPIAGAPQVRVLCDPRLGWSKGVPGSLTGSNHVAFDGFASPLRLTTDIPLAYLGGQPFTLTERRHMALTWGAPIEEPLLPLCDRFLGETIRYWQRWVKHCNIPPLYQPEVIRSALALKLHCFEDTGAIVASMTTSIPESPGSGRTWDYRYCWLRDATLTLLALMNAGSCATTQPKSGILIPRQWISQASCSLIGSNV